MKIPIILAQADVGLPPAPRADPGAYSGPARAAAAGFSDLNVSASRLAGALRRQEEQERIDRSRSEAVSLRGQLEDAIGEARARLSTITDPDEYLKADQEVVQGAQREVLQNARQPYTRELLEEKLAALRPKWAGEARARAAQLRKDAAGAEVDSALDSIGRRAGQLAPGDAAGLADLYGEVVEITDANAGTLGADTMAVRRRTERERLYYTHGRNDAYRDPQGFLDRVGSGFYDKMEPGQKETLVQAAERRLEQQERQDNARWDKWYKRVEKEAEKERESQLTDLSDLYFRGELTQAAIDEARRQRIIQTREELEHFNTLLRRPARTDPSDPTVLRDFDTGVYASQTPTKTARQVIAAMANYAAGQPGLNETDGRRLLGEIRRLQEKAQDDTRALQKDSYGRALTEGLRQLGIYTPLSQLDEVRGALAAAFEREFNARVLDKDGNVTRAAREVLYEILPIFQERQSNEAKLTYTQQSGVVGGLLKTAVPEALDPNFLVWYAQQQQAVEALKQNQPNVYQVRKEQLLHLYRTRRDILDAEARRQAAPKPGGRYTPPARTPAGAPTPTPSRRPTVPEEP